VNRWTSYSKWQRPGPYWSSQEGGSTSSRSRPSIFITTTNVRRHQHVSRRLIIDCAGEKTVTAETNLLLLQKHATPPHAVIVNQKPINMFTPSSESTLLPEYFEVVDQPRPQLWNVAVVMHHGKTWTRH
jgi:hypothetical protein